MDPEPTVRIRLPGTLALVTAVLTACGGDSDDAGGGSSTGPDDVLRVATEGTYSPFSLHDPSSNELTGYDVEVAQAVGAELGMEVEFSETQFDPIFAGLEADRYDVIANQITIPPGARSSTSHWPPGRRWCCSTSRPVPWTPSSSARCCA